MNVGLDLGTDRFRSLRMRDGRLIARSMQAVYMLLPDTVQGRALLERSQLPFAVCDDELILIGDAAAESASLFGKPALPLLPNGDVPTGDPPSRQIIATLIEHLLPVPESGQAVCGAVLPGNGSKAGGDFLTHLIRLAGYQPDTTTAGTAACLATLGDQSLTGIVLILGASSAEVVLVYFGREVARMTLDEGTSQIDREIAEREELFAFDMEGHRYRDENAIRATRESMRGSLTNPACEREARIADCYGRWLQTLLTRVSELKGELAMAGISRPLPMVCVGGPTQVQGFESFLAGRIKAAELPVQISEIRTAEPNFTVARGALIQAELSRSEMTRRAA
ncbi:disk-shape morphogenesis protein volactin [Calycomorphotria hydatis]|uniref:Competence protein A n=1 Tax=Calycomorphotria hydatis TaxID=2528027 RepID=A0A517T620_9PLAN|nr:hypothetical protein [Calycomorphotria hydatis]QDT63814.1 hypothetical protein V22_10390 [Calycomorphotria hydatis]